jgi:hypothetical protein
MMRILESRARVVERVAWENRLEKLEEQVAAGGKLRPAFLRSARTKAADGTSEDLPG